jgi:hypothetical protein
LLQAADESSYQYWVAFSGADAVLTDTEIRETLFEKGALADFTVSTNTEANMPSALNAITSSQGNSPCCIEVEAVSGGGDFTLTSDKVFDDLASIHFRYNGTSGTLTVVNTTGNASIGSSPFGGTLRIAERQTLTVTAVDLRTGDPVQNARVYIEAAAGGDLAAGTEIMNELTNVSGIATVTFDYVVDQPIVGRVRQGTTEPFYKTGTIAGPLAAEALDAVILLVEDE